MAVYSSRYSLPTALELRAQGARSQAALSHLKVEASLRVKYTGPGDDDSQAATIRTNSPVPPDCPLYYFEVEIVNRGALGFIGIGYMTEEVLQARLPGWEAHSYGYHGDDGFVFSGSGSGRPYGPTYTTGDVIGACFNRAERTIRYYKNGVDLGVAFHAVQDERLFPCVGLRSQGEEVLVNLGSSASAPLRLDVESLRGALREQVLASVAAVQLPLTCAPRASPGSTPAADSGAAGGTSSSKDKGKSADKEGSATPGPAAGQAGAAGSQGGAGPAVVPLLPKLVAEHLAHSRCWRTAAILTRDLLTRAPGSGDDPSASQPAPSTSQPDNQDAAGNEIAARQAVYDMVVGGRIEEARAALSSRYGPGLLEANPRLDFRLKVAHFCELVRVGGPAALDAALAYGRSVLAPHTPKGGDDEEVLSDALSLLAYDVPLESPCGHLLREPARVALAEEVNAAVLAAQGLPPTSPLERLAAQALVALDVLRASNHPQSQLLDVRKLCFGPQPTAK